MSFRAIKSAKSRKRAAPLPDLPSAEASPTEALTPPRLGRAAVQACIDCRRLKIKCDGNWPKCTTCEAKDRPCGYVGQEGQTRAAAVRGRMESLEELIAELRTTDSKRLDQILDRIRADEDPAGIMDHIASPSAPSPSQDKLDQLGNMLLLANRPIFDFRPLLPEPSVLLQAIDSFFNCSGKLFHIFSKDHISQCYQAVFDDDITISSERMKSKVCSLAAVAAVGAQYSPDTISREVELGLYNLARHFFEVAMEEEPLHAIKVCTLFTHYNIMNKQMIALTYVETGLSMCNVYGISNRTIRPTSIPVPEWSDLRKTWRTLIFFSSWLSSTLGYISGNSWLAEKTVLSDMKSDDPTNLADVVQTEMARICLLKADILRMHLAFKELTIPAVESIRKDLQTWYQELPETMRLEASGHDDLPVETKRTILHLHMLYLGATMLLYRRVATQFLQGYATGTSTGGFQHMRAREIFARQSADAVLAASTSARIVKLLLEDDGVFKHCWLVIFQTYTTGTILLHSAVQKQLHDFKPAAWEDDLSRAKDCLSVLAFCGTQDRVAAQFHEQLDSIFQRVVSYKQTTISSTASPSTEAQQVGAQQTSTLTPADDDTEASQQQQQQQAEDAHSYLLDVPAHADASRVNLSFFILMMLSQPFGDPDTKEAAALNMKKHWLTDPTRYEYPQMTERVDWDVENRRLFQWDLSKLGLPPLDVLSTSSKRSDMSKDVACFGPSSPSTSPGSFIGSAEPSGWRSATSMTTQSED